MVKEGGIYVTYQPLTGLKRYLIIRLGLVKQVSISGESMDIDVVIISRTANR